MALSRNLRLTITAIATLLIWGHIGWDYFHDGIPTHYMLHDENMPGIPNWVGGILLPFFTWFLLNRIHRRVDAPNPKDRLKTVIHRFLAALGVAILISILFTAGVDVIDYIMLAIFVMALVFPLYKSEYLLGWVLGSAYTFGATIPIVFGSVLALILFILYKIARVVKGFFMPQ